MNNYSEMSNDELRLEVAKRKGYTTPKAREWYHLYHNGKRYNSNSYSNPFMALRDIPRWPDDIGAAWELVDEMPKLNIRKTISGNYQVTYPERWVAGADTAQRAIVLAWLAWKDAKG